MIHKDISICTDKILLAHKKLKETRYFDNLFNCVSGDEKINAECRESRLDFEEEFNLFTNIVTGSLEIKNSENPYNLAYTIIPCFFKPTEFWRVCDTAIETQKSGEYCNNLCGELAINVDEKHLEL